MGEISDLNFCIIKIFRLKAAAIYGLGEKTMGLSQESRQPSHLRALLECPQPKHFMEWGNQRSPTVKTQHKSHLALVGKLSRQQRQSAGAALSNVCHKW